MLREIDTTNEEITGEAHRRGEAGDWWIRKYFSTDRYQYKDLDFEEALWGHWESLVSETEDVWARLLDTVLKQPLDQWKDRHLARIWQHGTQKGRKQEVGSMTAAWVCRLRGKKCLRDTHRTPREPQKLLRLTPQTGALMGVEPFVATNLDTPDTHGLLDALGVRNTPTGPEGILNLLRALARAAAPRADEVDKWHARLDTLVQQGTTEDLDTVRRAFGQDRLILAERGGWHSPKDVFITADEDEAPGAPLLRPEVRDLALWEKIGVRRRPTTEVVLEQLKGLEAFKPLKKEDADRVRRLLKRHARRVWEDLGHWVTPDNQWMPVEAFSHTRRKKDLEVASLFSAVLGKTADLSFLGEEDAAALPAAGLTALEDALSFRPEGAASGDDTRPPWMGALGRELARAVFDDADEQERVRTAARRLTATVLRAVGKLTVVPCLNGEPAGPPQPKRAVWDGEVLHVEQGSPAGLAQPVCDELARAFSREEIKRLLPLCYDRPAEKVVEYVRDQVRQDEAEAPVPVQAAPVPCELPMVELFVPPADAPGAAPRPAPAPAAKAPTESSPSVIKRFAGSKGFTPYAGTYRGEEGHRLEKDPDWKELWNLRSPDGEIVKTYWTSPTRFPDKPLSVPVEIWKFVNHAPEQYAFVVEGDGGNLRTLEVADLVAQIAEERATLHPETYRLEWNGER